MKSFLNFSRAREFVRKLNLKNTKEWQQYSASSKRPPFIPSGPSIYYSEWRGINDWLGTIRVRGRKRKYIINDDYFKTWSYDMAYILGFWWADGSITKSYQFQLCQKEKYILESILNIMNCDPKPIRPYHKCYICSIASKPIVLDIIKIGGDYKKSLTITFPSIPDEYISDFIRGYFDGDGSIYYDTTNQNYKSKITCGSKEFIYKLHSILKKLIPCLGGSIEETKPQNDIQLVKPKAILSKNTIYNLHFASSDTARLGHYLYSSSSILKLNRKYEMFVESIKINSTEIKHYSYEELKNIIKKQNIKNLTELFKYKRDQKDYRIPSQMTYYKNQYEGYNKLFEKFLPYEDAKKYISNMNFKGVKEFLQWIRTNNRPSNIHSNPQKFYKNSGWINWSDLLGKSTA